MKQVYNHGYTDDAGSDDITCFPAYVILRLARILTNLFRYRGLWARLFPSHPKMALLGGRAGRVDTGPEMEVKGERRSIPGYTPGPLWQNDGPKYGFKFTKITKVRCVRILDFAAR